MFVGVARYVLQIPGARSLKDRRQVVKSLKERLRARLGLSVAEVGDIERYQVATLGLAVVGRNSGLCRETLAKVTQMVGTAKDSILADCRTEIIAFGAAGKGLKEGLETLDLTELGAAEVSYPDGETE
ncbi:MAG: DUF503 domain-containing protein [Polyangiaceae bacterium]|nr:DUF503 domain-containing protein [Polyangiaceae bacterium]